MVSRIQMPVMVSNRVLFQRQYQLELENGGLCVVQTGNGTDKVKEDMADDIYYDV